MWKKPRIGQHMMCVIKHYLVMRISSGSTLERLAGSRGSDHVEQRFGDKEKEDLRVTDPFEEVSLYGHCRSKQLIRVSIATE